MVNGAAGLRLLCFSDFDNFEVTLCGGQQFALRCRCRFAIGDTELLQLLSLKMGQSGTEGLLFLQQVGFDGPVFLI